MNPTNEQDPDQGIWGLVIVPQEPTQTMLSAAMETNAAYLRDKNRPEFFDMLYAAMIAAAPKFNPPKHKQPEQ